MTTLITAESATFVTLTTEKGKQIGVGLGVEGMASIYIQAAGRRGLAMGRHFHADTTWGTRLLAVPLLRGVSSTGPLGITVSALLTTVAGEQWACSRELQRRLVVRFQQEAIPLADGLGLAWPSTVR
jgi:hypothetical protein